MAHPSHPQILLQSPISDPNHRSEYSKIIVLDDSGFQKIKAGLEAANAAQLGMTWPEDLGTPEAWKNGEEVKEDPTIKVTRPTTTVTQSMQRGLHGETTMRTQRVATPAVTQELTIRSSQNLADAASYGVELFEAGKKGVEIAKAQKVEVGLLYQGGFFGLFGTPKKQIILPRAADITRLKDFAEHNGLPPLQIKGRSLSLPPCE